MDGSKFFSVGPHGFAAVARWILISVLVVAAAAVAVSAEAQERPHGTRGENHAHGGSHGGHGMTMFDGSPERVSRRIDHLLGGLGATDAQRAQIKQIAMAAATELRSQHEAGRSLRERSLQILAAPNVDAAAAESVRAQIQSHNDQTSRRTLQAMLAVTAVLTPEQRAKIGERMKQRGAMMQERSDRLERERPSQ